MSGTVNKVILVCNLCADPEIRSFANGGKIANLRVATNETWKDRNSGERKERSEFHTVTIHAEPLVRLAEQYLKKGSKVYVEGQLETRKWQDLQGNDRYSTEVALRPFRSELHMLDGKDVGGSGTGYQTSNARQASYDAQKPQSGAPAGGADFDDSIPFAPCVLL